jgi:LPXTG-motif cell wall-anchored protein
VINWITSTASADYAIAWAVKMEVVLTTTSPSGPTFTVASGPTASNTQTGPPGPVVPPPDGNSGLGTGAIVGIVVGVVGALLLVGAFFFWRRRKQQHYHTSIPKASPGGEHDALPEFVGGTGTTTAPAQMTTSSSNGLFQPQPEWRASR